MYGFVTVPEFSMLMGISADTVYRLVRNDAIPYYRVQKRLHLLDESGLLVTMRRETNKFYQLNLDKLPFKGQVPGSLER